jgi:hypothetical protein
MARQVCIPHPGTACPGLNRGGRREAVPVGDQDRRRFLETQERRVKGDPRKGATGFGMAKAGR